MGSVRSAGNVTVITCNLPRNLRQGKIEKLRVIYVYFKFILSFLKSTLTGLITADKEYICDVDDTDVLSFIHSGHFYSTSSSPLLLRGAPNYSPDTVSEFHAEAHRQLLVKDLPQRSIWRLEQESNPQPSS